MVEVTQEDREAAASIAVLVEMRELIREGRADHHAEPFARHRIAALEEAATELERQDGHGEWSEAATAIPTLRARIAELESERAEWVEVERLRMGKPTPPTPPA